MNDERVPAPDPEGPARKPLREAIEEAAVRAPTRGNRKLESFLAAVNEDDQVRAWWYMQQVHAERLGMSDHSWVHMQIVLNIALRLLACWSGTASNRPSSPTTGCRRAMRRWWWPAAPCCTTSGCRSIATTTRPTASSSPPAPSTGCSPAPTKSRNAPWSRRRSCTRSSAIAGAGSPTRSRPVSSGSPTPSTWRRAGPGSRSRPVARASTRSPRRRSTRSGSSPARGGQCGSRSSSTTRPGSFRSMTCWRRRSAERRSREGWRSSRGSRGRARNACSPGSRLG